MHKEECYKLSEEEVKGIKKIYYKKTGLENLIHNIGEDNASDELLEKYGEICCLYNDAGQNIIEKNSKHLFDEVTQWHLDFTTRDFIVEFK